MNESTAISPMLNKKPFIFVVVVLLLSGLLDKAHAQSGADIGASVAEAAGRMIVSGTQDEIQRLAERYGLTVAQQLNQGGALVGTPQQLEALSRDSEVEHISPDAIVESSMAVGTTSIGADQVWEGAGHFGRITGAGIGVAIVDSGISDHPDLGYRVVASVDFAEPNGDGRDLYGHGTHVAGLVAGVAPDAHLINVRVLNDEGWGHASEVIAGIDYVVEHMDEFSIRVVNLSLGTGVGESFRTDPLGQAVERAVAAGLVVVVSAGNFGKTEEGTPVIGGVTSPGNTPSALTVGALNTFGTGVRSDDEVTSYSSRGPTAYDLVLKPDLVAPGNKIVSLEAPASYLSTNYPERLVAGGYIQLSGTSMSTAFVSGAVALLLQGNPSLTPQQVKVALQSTASPVEGAGLVEAGAGSLNVISAMYIGLMGPNVAVPNASREPGPS